MKGLVAFSLVVLLCGCAITVLPQGRARRVEQTTISSAAGTVVPEESGEVVRVDTTLVTVPVSVMDRDGRYIYDLRKEDFRLFEDGVEQDVAFFESVEKPFTVVLMLDTSSSTWLKHEQIKRAAAAFIDQLRPDDRVMIVSFASGLTVECEPTSDRLKLTEAIQRVGRGFNTKLYDAVAWVMKERISLLRGRKAVVLLTDGVDAKSKHATYESNLHAAEELDALIYPVEYDTYEDQAILSGGRSNSPASTPAGLPSIISRLPLPGSAPQGGGNAARVAYARADEYLRLLAEKSGGRFYQAREDAHQIERAFGQIAQELRHQYSLGYYPKLQAKGMRRISVRVNRPNLAVRARRLCL